MPGLPAGLGALSERFGRLPWRRLVEPAIRLAQTGVRMPPAHAACLAMLEPVFTLTPEGRAIYAPGGYLLESGEVLAQPGLTGAMEILAAEGPRSVVPRVARRGASRGRRDPAHTATISGRTSTPGWSPSR